MSTNRIIKGIAFETEIFAALEKLRGNNAHFRSKFVNDAVREKIGLTKKEGKKK
jgi:hypothetical protein